jgi:hypothetical protein
VRKYLDRVGNCEPLRGTGSRLKVGELGACLERPLNLCISEWEGGGGNKIRGLLVKKSTCPNLLEAELAVPPVVIFPHLIKPKVHEGVN